ncbi:MotA/TolQ/ExbB proton channel family protein [Oscillospiraceae bacterium WX1]
MNIFLLLGLLIGFGGVIYGYIGDEGVLSALLKPTAASIVFGGTIGFVLLSFPLTYLKQLPKALKMILFRKKKNYAQVIDLLYGLANVARRDGILAMEAEAEKVNDPFIKKGLLYVADGVEPDFLKEVLENEIEAKTREFEQAAKVMEGAGGVSPAMGVLGTVMGMVSILREMGADMEALGHKIATAFIATMYGVGAANLLWLPIGAHINNCADEDAAYMGLIVTGLLSILEGEYPARMRDNLIASIGGLEEGKSKPQEKSA